MPPGDVSVLRLSAAEASLVERGVDPVWTWSDWQDWLTAPASEEHKWRTNASLLPAFASREPKWPRPRASLLLQPIRRQPAAQIEEWLAHSHHDEPRLRHAHPLNLLRLYLAELPALQHLDRILLIDDDVLFQRDLASLFETSMPDGKLLQASCAMYKVRQDEDGSRWLKLSRAE